MDDDPRRRLSIAAAARAFRFSPRRLRAAVRCGELAHSRPGSRIVYVSDADVERWLRTLTVPPTPTTRRRAPR